MLIALTTLVTRARVRVRGLLGIGLGLSRLGLRPLQSQALPVQLQHAQRLRFGPLKALGVGLESVRESSVGPESSVAYSESFWFSIYLSIGISMGISFISWGLFLGFYCSSGLELGYCKSK